MTTIRLTHYGMDGEGPTVTAAKLDAGRKVERALDGAYDPRVLRFGPSMAIVYRTPTGWYWAYVRKPEDKDAEEVCGNQAGFRDESPADGRANAIRAAKRALAQDAWTGANSAECTSYLHKDDRHDFMVWERFKRAYKDGKAQGMDYNAAHAFACNK